jgi:hypothetical protein
MRAKIRLTAAAVAARLEPAADVEPVTVLRRLLRRGLPLHRAEEALHVPLGRRRVVVVVLLLVVSATAGAAPGAGHRRCR